MKKHNPEMWRRFLLLMDHDEERKLETDYQEMFQVTFEQQTRCLKITEKVSYNIASEASYVYILSGQKFIKNAKNGPLWRVFEILTLAVIQC